VIYEIWSVADDAKKHVQVAYDELTLAKAQGNAAVTASAGLKEHDGPPIARQVSDGFKRRGRGIDTRWLNSAGHATSSLEKTERFGAVAHKKVLRP
jgi:hypothetical protein